MVALRPGGELPLKGAAFLASPIVDAVGQQDGGNGIRFFLRETWPGREGGVEHVSFSRECGRGCRPRLRLEEHPWSRSRPCRRRRPRRSEEHTSELQSLMRLSYAVFCLK